MINEIYVNNELVIYENPKKQFKSGYTIKCVNCNSFIERKYYDKKILEIPYKCKKCVLTYDNPMKDESIRKKVLDYVSSDLHKKRMSGRMTGSNNPFYGKTHSQKSINIIIESNKNYRNNLTDDEREKISKRCSDIQKKLLENNPIEYRRKRSKAARQSHKSQFDKREMNKIEKKVYDYLINMGIDVKFSVILASYQYDFGIKDKKILIEVDGDYWHGNPNYYNENGSNEKKKLNKIQMNKINRDIEKNSWAISRGFKLIRIWEEDINNGSFIHKLNTL